MPQLLRGLRRSGGRGQRSGPLAARATLLTSDPRDPLDRITFALAVGTVLLFPLVGLPREDGRTALAPAAPYLYAADVAQVALALLAIPQTVAGARRLRGAESVLWGILLTWIAIAFAMHPSVRGGDVVLRIFAAAALYRVVVELAPSRRRIIAGALGLVAILQALAGALQVATGAPLGLQELGELTGPALDYGGPRILARGTLGHEFILAALALVSATVLIAEAMASARPGRWTSAAAFAVSAAGLVYGRTVAVALVISCASLVRAAVRHPRYRWALFALVAGAGIPAALASAGWASSFARGAETDRGSMVQQATAIAAASPLVGVGPGNYLAVLEAHPELQITRQPQNVHNVPLMLAAEAGVPAGLVASALLVLVGIAALRAGAPALTLYLAYLPFAVLDALPYVTPQGLVLSALWLAFLQAARRSAPGPARPR